MTPERWQQVTEVFNSALGQDPAQRSRFLKQACEGDEELRKEVESLLSSYQKDGDPLDIPIPESLLGEEHDLSPGSTINHYKIISKIGGGGMGEVYLAEDTVLRHKVALKLLTGSLSYDKQFRARFIREAQLAAALDHPNICTIHYVGEENGRQFIVMQYVEGQTLKQVIDGQPMSLNDLQTISQQVGEALTTAHAQGIVHRDIKPANIMLTPRGQVKVLDFGLGKLLAESEDGDHSGLTRTGAQLGTPSYMSPEQVRGAEVDQRSDIFSFGLVLYEMATGRLAFKGDSEWDTKKAVIEKPHRPAGELNPTVPPQLSAVIDKALAKDAGDRYQSIEELIGELGRVKDNATPFQRVVNQVRRVWQAIRRKPQGMKWSKAALLLLGIGGLVYLIWKTIPPGEPQKPPLPPMKVSQLTSFVGLEENPSFSPDGNFLAFTWTGEKNDNRDIYVMQIGGTGAPTRLTTDPGEDLQPVWSPDGKFIAFSRFKSETNKAAFIIPAFGGGVERKIYTSEVKAVWGGSKQMDWSPDGKWLVSPDRVTTDGPYQLFLTSPETLERRQLTFAPDHNYADLFPQFSPNGNLVAFVRGGNLFAQDIYIVETAGGEPRQLTFDGKHIEALTWTTDGRKLVFSSNRDGVQRLWSIASSGGTPEAIAVTESGASIPSISRSGNRLAYVRRSSDGNMYSISLRGSVQVGRPFASSTKGDWMPRFSPDGRTVAFTSDRSGFSEIWLCNNDGSSLRSLTTFETESGKPIWSPDGQMILFDSKESGSFTRDVYVMSADGGPRRRLTPVDNYDDNHASWSRDGQWIYFNSKRSGDWQIWKVPATGGTPVQFTQKGGVMPFESADGQFVYYGKKEVDGIWRAPVKGGDEELVLAYPLGEFGGWALMPDGIYYIDMSTKEGAGIMFYNFSSRRTKEVVSLGKVTIRVQWVGFAVSPDGQQAIYTLVDREDSDIMLVENFQL